MAPRPGRVPIHVGGHSAPALRRAARQGDGWIGSPRPPELLAEQVDQVVPALERSLATHGRPRAGFEITAAVLGQPGADVLELAARAGLDRLIVAPWVALASPPALERAIEDLNAIAASAEEPS